MAKVRKTTRKATPRKRGNVVIAKGGRSGDAILSVPVGNIVVSDKLPGKIRGMHLKSSEARALRKDLNYLDTEKLSVIASNPHIPKAIVGGKKIYSLQSAGRIKIMFGIDDESGKVLVYDILESC